MIPQERERHLYLGKEVNNYVKHFFFTIINLAESSILLWWSPLDVEQFFPWITPFYSTMQDTSISHSLWFFPLIVYEISKMQGNYGQKRSESKHFDNEISKFWFSTEFRGQWLKKFSMELQLKCFILFNYTSHV